MKVNTMRRRPERVEGAFGRHVGGLEAGEDGGERSAEWACTYTFDEAALLYTRHKPALYFERRTVLYSTKRAQPISWIFSRTRSRRIRRFGIRAYAEATLAYR